MDNDIIDEISSKTTRMGFNEARDFEELVETRHDRE